MIGWVLVDMAQGLGLVCASILLGLLALRLAYSLLITIGTLTGEPPPGKYHWGHGVTAIVTVGAILWLMGQLV